MDRVVIEEDQTRGQLILAYQVVAMDATDASTAVFANGTSVGTRRIAFADGSFLAAQAERKRARGLPFSKLRLEVIATVHELPPAVTRFAAFKICACPAGSPSDATC